MEIVGAAIASAIAVPAAAIATVNALGWTAAGVVAGSTAAVAQAGIGSVAAGSAFAAVQSFAALGLGSAIMTVGLPLAAVSLIGFGAYKIFS